MDPMLLWGIGLMLAAAVILLLEVFLPSGGILGLLAFVVAVAGVVVLFRYDTIWGVSGIGAMVVILPAFGWFMLNIFPDTPVGRRFILGREDRDDENDGNTPRNAPDARLALRGATGEVAQTLRPVGFIVIDGTRHEAISDTGDVLDPGTAVRVVGIDLHELRVRKA